MKRSKYNDLLEREIQKEYRKITPIEAKNVENGQKAIVKKLELENRVFATTQRQAFATLKDHKPNFHNNPAARLINPSKPEIGQISKISLEEINKAIRTKTGLKQWQNPDAVIEWFESIERKKFNTFIKFDVINFYPSITQKILSDAIKWARKFVTITPEDENSIMEAKKSLLFKDGVPWAKKGNSFFDIAQGSYDGAETCELVGLFLLDEISKIQNLNVGLYRDDGLACTTASPRQAEKIRQKVAAIFKKHGLGTTSTANTKQEEFLDVYFDLENESFRPYLKENNIPLYVHKLSNHPPSVIKSIPEGVNKRLSSRSSSEEMFETTAPIYREALAKSGYDFPLKFDPKAREPNKKKKRKRNRNKDVLWFNPPYSATVRSRIGRDFLNLVSKSFPPGHPLRKIFNRNTLKVGYSCTPNIEKIISSRNKKLLATPQPEERMCNCPKNSPCPLGGKCLQKNVIYQATVTQEDGKTNSYTGQCSTTFKARLGTHRQSFKTEGTNPTSLSNFIWDLKHKRKKFEVTWKILDRGEPFSPITEKCILCIKEKFHILFNQGLDGINSRNEVFSACRHKAMKLLIPPDRKKKGPG